MMITTNTEKVGNDEKRPRRLLGISNLSDGVIGEVFKFLGRGHFRFVAGTSRHFYRVYQTMCKNENYATTTTMKSVVESISRSKLYLSETGRRDLVAKNAAKYGNFEVLRNAYYRAIKVGDLSTWKDMNLCQIAAGGGSLEVLQWLRRGKKFQWDWKTCRDAAANGHLEVLQWARAHGCPWNEWTCRYAAENGHLEVLQ